MDTLYFLRKIFLDQILLRSQNYMYEKNSKNAKTLHTIKMLKGFEKNLPR